MPSTVARVGVASLKLQASPYHIRHSFVIPGRHLRMSAPGQSQPGRVTLAGWIVEVVRSAAKADVGDGGGTEDDAGHDVDDDGYCGDGGVIMLTLTLEMMR